LSPGGLIEFQEYHCQIYSDDGIDSLTPSLLGWVDNMILAAEKIRRLMPIIDQITPWIQDARLVNVQEVIY